MDAVPLAEVVSHLDALLRVAAFSDASQNGLQVENAGAVRRVAAAVDARAATVALAREAGADLMVVHHGLFWRDPERLVGAHYHRVRALIEAGVALYAAHLPLDAHPEVGHNATLGRALGLSELRPFGRDRAGQEVGMAGVLDPPLDAGALAERLGQAVAPYGGEVRRYGRGPAVVRSVGLVTGDAADWVVQAARAGLDAYVTGETDHATACLADELGVHLLCGGHYATETYGVRALAEHLSRRFGLPWVFVHAPTGL